MADLLDDEPWEPLEALGAPVQGVASSEAEASAEGTSEGAVPEVSGPEASSHDAASTSPLPGPDPEELSFVSQAEDAAQQQTTSARALSLSEGEVIYMEELASAVGRSPRRLKRFVNVYRILKASCTPAQALRFVRPDGLGGEYRAAMTLLALTTGAPSLASDLYQLLHRQAPDIALGPWLEALGDYAPLQDAEPKEAEAVYHAFGVFSRFEGADVPLRTLQGWARRVMRFTFRSGRP